MYKRDISLDYAKGLAMLLVVIYHLYDNTGRENDSVVYSFCHVVQLPIFFYVSGLLLAKSINKGRNVNLVNKSVRLILPLCSFYLIWGMINNRYFLSFPMGEYKRGYWFILVLFEMMLLFSLSYRLFRKSLSPWPHVLLYLLFTLYEGLIPKGNVVNVLFSINLLWHYYPFFLLGVFSDRIRFLMKIKYAVVYFIVFGAVFYAYLIKGGQTFVPLCNLFSLVLLMTLISHQVLPCMGLGAKIGRFSMQIYLLHFFVLELVCPHIPIVENRWLECAFYTTIAIVIIATTVFVSKILEKSKWLALFLFGVRTANKTHNMHRFYTSKN